MLNLSPEIESSIEGDHVFCHLIEMQLNGLTIRLTEADFDIDYKGETYLGNGVLLEATGASETSDITVNKSTISFTAAEQSMLAVMLSNPQVDRPVKVYRAYLDDSYNVVGAITLTWGTVTSFASKVESGNAILDVEIAGPFSDWERVSGRRTTNASQQRFYPGDKGMEFANQIKDELKWGGK